MDRSRHRSELSGPARATRGTVVENATRGTVVEASRRLPATEARERLQRFRAHALHAGVNPLLYWPVRAVLVPFFRVYFRLQRIGAEHLPRSGPLLLAANHRSFLDPFVIGALTRRPVYYVAKRELFERRWQAWLLSALGAFPIDRGAGDADAMATARAILRRGDCVVIFPEGTRVRRGPLGAPRRGIGRLALETGARVVPVARDRHRGRAPRLARAPAQGAHPLRRPAGLPDRRSILRRRSPPPSPSASGRVSACSGNGCAARPIASVAHGTPATAPQTRSRRAGGTGRLSRRVARPDGRATEGRVQ